MRKSETNDSSVDVIIVGAGFAGMYMLYYLRKKGLKARILEAGDDVGGKVLLAFEKVAVVHHQADHLAHVVGTVGVGRNDLFEGGLPPISWVRARSAGGCLAVVGG